MSGSASSGMRPRDQMPAATSRSTPAKTRKRLAAHHSMVRWITSHPSRCIERELPAGDDLAVLARHHVDLPGAAPGELALALVDAAALLGLLAGGDDGLH